MSEILFIQAHLDGAEQSVSSSGLLAAIQPYIVRTDAELPGWYDLAFTEFEGCSISFRPDVSGAISSFGVHRPCGDRRLYDLLFRYMSQANWVLFNPSGDLFVVVSSAVSPHLPPDMIESLGPLTIAPDAEAFYRACTYATRA